jgi:hypothetical protein
MGLITNSWRDLSNPTLCERARPRVACLALSRHGRRRRFRLQDFFISPPADLCSPSSARIYQSVSFVRTGRQTWRRPTRTRSRPSGSTRSIRTKNITYVPVLVAAQARRTDAEQGRREQHRAERDAGGQEPGGSRAGHAPVPAVLLEPVRTRVYVRRVRR